MEQNQEDNGNKLEEYLSYFANISEDISNFPFSLEEITIQIKVEPYLHHKIHREIELLSGITGTLGKTPDSYEIEISGVTFKFTTD
jgi:hypothetical protein|tara:strand:- start:2458 stop:2715 length:258 start_codon:yes stop_codon:yes gene_type:complete